MGDIKVSVDLSGVKQKLSSGNFKLGQQSMSNQMMADMNLFVPYDQGDLRNSVMMSPDGSFVIWNSPYAKRQFRGIGIHNYTTPGTGPRWDLKAKDLYMDSWIRAFQEGAKL